jgi:hypothetical protein
MRERQNPAFQNSALEVNLFGYLEGRESNLRYFEMLDLRL